jgi:hypothetical protein
MRTDQQCRRSDRPTSERELLTFGTIVLIPVAVHEELQSAGVPEPSAVR